MFDLLCCLVNEVVFIWIFVNFVGKIIIVGGSNIIDGEFVIFRKVVRCKLISLCFELRFI